MTRRVPGWWTWTWGPRITVVAIYDPVASVVFAAPAAPVIFAVVELLHAGTGLAAAVAAMGATAFGWRLLLVGEAVRSCYLLGPVPMPWTIRVFQHDVPIEIESGWGEDEQIVLGVGQLFLPCRGHAYAALLLLQEAVGRAKT